MDLHGNNGLRCREHETASLFCQGGWREARGCLDALWRGTKTKGTGSVGRVLVGWVRTQLFSGWGVIPAGGSWVENLVLTHNSEVSGLWPNPSPVRSARFVPSILKGCQPLAPVRAAQPGWVGTRGDLDPGGVYVFRVSPWDVSPFFVAAAVSAAPGWFPSGAAETAAATKKRPEIQPVETRNTYGGVERRLKSPTPVALREPGLLAGIPSG